MNTHINLSKVKSMLPPDLSHHVGHIEEGQGNNHINILVYDDKNNGLCVIRKAKPERYSGQPHHYFLHILSPQREIDILESIKRNLSDLKVPRILYRGIDFDDGLEFIVVSLMAGEDFSKLSDKASQDEFFGYMHQLGQQLRLAHNIGFTNHGQIGTNSLVLDPYDSWSKKLEKAIFGKIKDSKMRSSLNKYFTQDFLENDIMKFFNEQVKLLDKENSPRLILYDIHGGNFRVKNGELSGIIDLELALSGHRAADFTHLEFSTANRAKSKSSLNIEEIKKAMNFLYSGYGLTKEEREYFDLLRPIHVVNHYMGAVINYDRPTFDGNPKRDWCNIFSKGVFNVVKNKKVDFTQWY